LQALLSSPARTCCSSALGVSAGQYSLGLFVVHKWVWYLVALLAAHIAASTHVEYFVPIAVAALTIGVSCLLVAFLSRTPGRFLVTGDRSGSPGSPR